MSPIHSGGGGHMSCLTAGLTCEDVANPCTKAAPAPSLQGRSQARHSGHEHQGDVDNDVKMRRHRFGAVTGPPEAANETEEACFTRMPRCTPEKMCCLGLSVHHKNRPVPPGALDENVPGAPHSCLGWQPTH